MYKNILVIILIFLIACNNQKIDNCKYIFDDLSVKVEVIEDLNINLYNKITNNKTEDFKNYIKLAESINTESDSIIKKIKSNNDGKEIILKNTKHFKHSILNELTGIDANSEIMNSITGLLDYSIGLISDIKKNNLSLK